MWRNNRKLNHYNVTFLVDDKWYVVLLYVGPNYILNNYKNIEVANIILKIDIRCKN